MDDPHRQHRQDPATPRTAPRGRTARRRGLACAAVALLLVGCGEAAPETRTTAAGGAVAACFAAAEENGRFDLPLDEGERVDVSVSVDEQGWLEVLATTGGGDALTCTAVHDESPLGARAASWSVTPG